MNIQVNSNAFTTLDRMIGISNVQIEVLKSQLENNILNGEIRISGEYYTDESEYEDNNGLKEFENVIPFEIVFTKSFVEIVDILIKDFGYYEVAGRGIEASFIIDVEYIEKEMEVRFREEDIKEAISENIDELLTEKMEVKEDNFLENDLNRGIIEDLVLEENVVEKDIDSQKQDVKSTITVFYYEADTDIQKFCKQNQLSYEEVLKENAKYPYANCRRIIVSD